SLQGVPWLGGRTYGLGAGRHSLIVAPRSILEKYSQTVAAIGNRLIVSFSVFCDFQRIRISGVYSMLRTFTRRLLAAGALSVLTLTVAAPMLGSGLSNSIVSIRAEAQEAAHPIIVNLEQFKELIGNGAKIVDVRQPAAFEAGHIPGAVNLPWAKLNVSE